MEIAGIVGVIIAGLTLLGGLAVWAMRATIAPLQVVIENNTTAIKDFRATMERHECTLDDHEGRIIKVETIQGMEVKL